MPQQLSHSTLRFEMWYSTMLPGCPGPWAAQKRSGAKTATSTSPSVTRTTPSQAPPSSSPLTMALAWYVRSFAFVPSHTTHSAHPPLPSCAQCLGMNMAYFEAGLLLTMLLKVRPSHTPHTHTQHVHLYSHPLTPQQRFKFTVRPGFKAVPFTTVTCPVDGGLPVTVERR